MEDSHKPFLVGAIAILLLGAMQGDATLMIVAWAIALCSTSIFSLRYFRAYRLAGRRPIFPVVMTLLLLDLLFYPAHRFDWLGTYAEATEVAHAIALVALLLGGSAVVLHQDLPQVGNPRGPKSGAAS